ncbi:uncharacterized protein [Procambarus clarkii]|uniref:uncharacterized protein n=1 Tax=Procambarus clarkii TaxID=6728 RepID=UPI0037443C53
MDEQYPCPGSRLNVSLLAEEVRRSGWVLSLAAMLPCAVIFCSMALLKWREYASFPVYTSYKTHYLEEVIFPGVTFCVWPPFNPRRLADLGVGYNFSHHCQRLYEGLNFKTKCDWVQVFKELLKELPGAWTQDLGHIWQEGAWRPQDLFTSFTKLSRQFNVGLQRCGDAKYFWKRDQMFLPNSVHDFWKCYLDYFKMFVVVHPPHEAPVLLDPMTTTEVMVAANNVKTRIEVSLDVYDRLSSGETPCVQEEEAASSQDACVQRCVADAAVSQRGCRLPYAAWSAAPLCSREEYMAFPKFDPSAIDSLSNRSHAWAACLAACPETCRVLRYTTSDTIASKSNIEVAFARPLYNEISESWSYSSVQLVSDVASVASLFLGVSFYQILTCCLHQRRSDDVTAR